LIFLGISLLIFFVSLNVDYKILSLYYKQIYFIILVLLIFVFLIGIEAKGAVRWIDFFGIRIQFSEIIKPFIVIFFARFLTQDTSRSFRKFSLAFIFLLPIFLLTAKQPDLGNAIIYLMTLLFMLFLYGFPLRFFAGIFFIFSMLSPVLFLLLHDYQRQRVLSFLGITNDITGFSYNLVQAAIAVGSGGFWGKGFGEATQSVLRFLPERHTDFIFAMIAESTGFVGALLVILSFVFLLSRIFQITLNTEDEFYYLCGSGFFGLFLSHIFLNIGMNIGILPIVGITLPFTSYGGSSLLTNFWILSILSLISFSSNKQKVIEIK
jgi:rod shape determining protein RodA